MSRHASTKPTPSTGLAAHIRASAVALLSARIERRSVRSPRLVGPTLVLMLALAAVVPSADAKHSSGHAPWLVVLCNFTNSPPPPVPYTRDYYQRMFGEQGAGQGGLYDYWRDVSFQQLSIGGTDVTSWAIARNKKGKKLTRDAWGSRNLKGQEYACARGSGVRNFSRYHGIVTVFPEALSRTTEPISSTDTSVQIERNEFFPRTFPRPPFLLEFFPDPWINNRELAKVTRIDESDNRLFIERGARGTTPRSYGTGAAVKALGGDLKGTQGKDRIKIRGTTYRLARAIMAHQGNVSAIGHEMGHGFDLLHTFKLSTSTTTYGNCPDLMSWNSGCGASSGWGVAFGTSLQGWWRPGQAELRGSKGPGLVAPNLDRKGWIPASKRFRFDPSQLGQRTIDLHSLSDPNGPSGAGFLAARVPAAMSIPISGGTTTSDYYSIEYREQRGWDLGLPDDSVNLQLHGRNDWSFWVDQAGRGGWLYPGDDFVDAANRLYLGVNARSASTRTATVTLASSPILATMAWTGARMGNVGERVRLESRLTVGGSGAPVPGKLVRLSVGTSACTPTTDASGMAACAVTLQDPPGTYTAEARFGTNGAYRGASAIESFTVNPRPTTQVPTRVTYTGPTAATEGSTVEASATLRRTSDNAPLAGKTVGFVLRARSCFATTDSVGRAACSLFADPPPREYTLETSFAGDSTYEPSTDRDNFTIAPFG